MTKEVKAQVNELSESGSWGGGQYYNFREVQGQEDPWVSDWFNSSIQPRSGGHQSYNSSLGGHLLESGGHLYQAIIQGVLVCLFTTVGGVMLLVFCLIIIQECKVEVQKSFIHLDLYWTVDVCVGGEEEERGGSSTILSRGH